MQSKRGATFEQYPERNPGKTQTFLELRLVTTMRLWPPFILLSDGPTKSRAAIRYATAM